MRKLILTILLLLAACSARLELTVAPNTKIAIRDGIKVQHIQPGTPAYQELEKWIARIQTGWSKYYATTPSGGIFVSDGNMTLQFSGSSVITHHNEQTWTKPVQESEYQFLRNKLSGT